MTDIKEQKKAIRQDMKQNLGSLSNGKKLFYSEKIISKLKTHLAKFDTRGIFFPLDDEPQIQDLIQTLRNHDKTLVVPQIIKEEMKPVLYRSYSEIGEGNFGVKKIIWPEIHKGEIDVILIPGRAFSANYQRIGRGKGYYDTFLAQHPESYKIGLCFPEQIYKELPTDDHDIDMDMIVY